MCPRHEPWRPIPVSKSISLARSLGRSVRRREAFILTKISYNYYYYFSSSTVLQALLPQTFPFVQIQNLFAVFGDLATVFDRQIKPVYSPPVPVLFLFSPLL